jgi:PAS domain-containing protein
VRTDVTEIKHAQEELARAKETLETTFNSVDQGILMVDGEYRIAAYNQRLAELLDLPKAILDGNPGWAKCVRYSFEQGEFEAMGLGGDGNIVAQIDQWIEERRNLTEPVTHRYRRPNGVELEIWTNPLSTGGWYRFTATSRNAMRLKKRSVNPRKDTPWCFKRPGMTFMIWTWRPTKTTSPPIEDREPGLKAGMGQDQPGRSGCTRTIRKITAPTTLLH